MAWFIGGLIALGAGGYIFNEMKNKVNALTQPLYDYIDKEKRDAEQRECELRHQQHIQSVKELRARHDAIRKQYALPPRTQNILINNTYDVCYIYYVDKSREDPIAWVNIILQENLFDGQVLNKRNTPRAIMGVDTRLEIIKEELKLYHIVINWGKDCRQLETDNGELTITELFGRKKPMDTELFCYF